VVRGEEAEIHLPARVENAMFRIVQESLTNVIKHSRASEVIINVAVVNGRLQLSVEDNGVGYDGAVATPADGRRGWGLITMSERALAIGGICRVESSPGLGTHVVVEVPV